MSPVTVEKICEPCELGEGPHWDAEKQTLYFVDVPGRRIYKYQPSTHTIKSITFGERSSFIIPVKDSKDKFVISVDRKLVVMTWDGESDKPAALDVITTVDNEKGKEDYRVNDAKADATGRLWAGTMGPMKDGEVQESRGIVFSLSKDKKATTHETGVGISNGIAWSLDNKIMYYIDSPLKRVDAFDFDITAGKIANRRTIFDFKEHGVEGSPDGQTIDTNGNLWVACFGGNQVIQVDPRTGKLLQRVDIPALNVTSVTWGGSNLDELFVTSASVMMSEADKERFPMAGCTFRVTGLGSKGFAGQPVAL